MASFCYYKTKWSSSIVARRYKMTLEMCMPDAVFPWYCMSDPRDGTYYVAISGTNAWEHWKTNARINQERLVGDIQAHAGATRMVRDMLPDVRAVITDAPRAVFLGHSIGGSMSCLFAMVLREQEEGRRPVSAIALGSPPVLSQRIQDAPVENVLIDLDVVPRVLTAMYRYGGSLTVLQPNRKRDPYHSSMPQRPGAFRVDTLAGMESFCPPPTRIATYHLSHTYTRVLRDLLAGRHPSKTLDAS